MDLYDTQLAKQRRKRCPRHCTRLRGGGHRRRAHQHS